MIWAWAADLVLAAILVFFALRGAKKGLFKSLMSLIVVAASLLGAGLLASFLAEPVTELVYPLVEEKCTGWFTQLGLMTEGLELNHGFGDTGFGEAASSALAEMLPGLENLLERFHIDPSGLLGRVGNTAGDAASVAARMIVASMVKVVLLILFFIGLMIVLSLLVKMVNMAFKLPGLHFLNTWGGALFNMAAAALVMLLAVRCAGMLGFSAFQELEQTSLVLRFLTSLPAFFAGKTAAS